MEEQHKVYNFQARECAGREMKGINNKLPTVKIWSNAKRKIKTFNRSETL
ncbi:hypothetical protein [Flavobacterium johnsoniae]|nr:hypothetical protein [Flavobacterium johnsoniae]